MRSVAAKNSVELRTLRLGDDGIGLEFPVLGATSVLVLTTVFRLATQFNVVVQALGSSAVMLSDVVLGYPTGILSNFSELAHRSMAGFARLLTATLLAGLTGGALVLVSAWLEFPVFGTSVRNNHDCGLVIFVQFVRRDGTTVARVAAHWPVDNTTSLTSTVDKLYSNLWFPITSADVRCAVRHIMLTACV